MIIETTYADNDLFVLPNGAKHKLPLPVALFIAVNVQSSGSVLMRVQRISACRSRPVFAALS